MNRVQAGGVQAYLVLRNGTEFGAPIASGAAIKTTTIMLNAPTRVDGASLTLAVDASLVSEARRTLRRVLMITAGDRIDGQCCAGRSSSPSGPAAA